MAVKTQKLCPMEVQTGVIIDIRVRSDYVDYFNIPEIAGDVDRPLVLKKRAAHTRTIYPTGLGDGAGVGVNVGEAKWYGLDKEPLRNGTALKIIKVPSELVTVKGAIRYATIHIPNGITNGIIANWINTKFLSHPPTFFLTPSGIQHPVNISYTGDPNPDQDGPNPT